MNNEAVYWCEWLMQKEPSTTLQWTVYILKCADGTLYTGCTNDLTARLLKHNTGTGAKYTRGRAPVHIAYSEPQKDRSAALKREASLKRLTRKEKQELARTFSERVS